MLRPTPARHSARAEVTRRAMLGVAALVAGMGLADLLHRPKRGTLSASDQSNLAGSATHLEAERTGHQTARPPSLSAHDHPAAHNGPTVSAPSPTVRGRAHNAQHGGDFPSLHGHGDAPGPRHTTAGGRAVKAEHVALPPPKVRVHARPIYEVKDLLHHPPHRAIALTVDDGPDPDWTPKVLRLLDKYRMQASFCVVGLQAEAHPRLIRDIAKAGHVLVNHTYTHVQPFNRQTEQRIVAEITRTQRAIERVAKVEPQLFRAPGGSWSPFIFRAIAAYGLLPLDWDIDPDDWARPGTKKIERAMFRGRPGDIVLCHDGGGNRSETVRALRKVLPVWKRRHYTTIPLVVPPHYYHQIPDLAASSPPATSESANPSETKTP
jgi:peptidoglycan-N-acetylglucosamine deacetylase